jgi:hypothetical protein
MPGKDQLSLRSKLNQVSANVPQGASRKRYDSHDFAGYGTYDLKHTPQNSEVNLIAQRLFHQEEHAMLNELVSKD